MVVDTIYKKTKGLSDSGASLMGAVLCLLLLLMIGEARAFNFTPTESEWARWPYYCQAMYAHLDVAKSNGYWKRIPKKDADYWFKLGDQEGGAWHYCAGLSHLDQAEAEFNPVLREQKYRGAIADVMFSYNRTLVTSPWSARYSVALARAYRGLKEYVHAARFLNEAIAYHPDNIAAYSLLSLVLMDQGQYAEAKAVLLRGDGVVQGKSAEFAYFLGLASVELGEFAAAREYADRANSLGYPLGGLRQKIDAAERASLKKK